jgi:long-chain acyl-CoA synthetase
MPERGVRFGTVGRPLPNVELKIADDGEVLARGPNVMRGYLNRPADTAEALRDGWFHTGDIGTIDRDGYLTITDRKKEMLATSGGKKIAPQPIEAALRADPLVEEAVLIAEGRHFPTVLLVPDMPALCHKFYAARPASLAEARTLLAEPRVIAAYQAIVDRVNTPLAQFERPKKFALLPEPFTVAGGELTPTLKVKRRVVDAKYASVIESFYRG